MSRLAVNFFSDLDAAERDAVLSISDPDAAVATRPEYRHLFQRQGFPWIALTYMRLRNSDALDVRLSDALDEDVINVGHSPHLGELHGARSNCFVVVTQADFQPRHWGQFHIVQNSEQVRRHAELIQHWPQPGLTAHDPARKGMRTVGYVGRPYNRNLAASAEAFAARLAAEGFELRVPDEARWHDMSQIDVSLAIRSFGSDRHSTKPASKLMNAWRAGVPFIGGADSAYLDVGTPGVNYLLARNFDEITFQLKRLRDEPGLRDQLVANGLVAAAQFTDDKIAARWIEVLTKSVAPRFAAWRAHPHTERLRAGLLWRLDRMEYNVRALVRRGGENGQLGRVRGA